MAVSSTDIVFVLSGGTLNQNPYLSLGGNPSSYLIQNDILFDNVTEEEKNNGNIDYRCFYIFNNNVTSTFFDTELFIQEETAEGSNVLLGINVIDDVQKLIVTGTPSSGSFTLSFDTSNLVVNYDNNPITWATNLQTALNGISQLNTTQVSVLQSLPVTTFTITFTDEDGKRNQPLLQLVTNALNPASDISISKVIEGSPINSIAPDIGVNTTPPTGISFSYPIESSPIVIGDLKAEEGFPVWIQRTTTIGPVENDGFIIRFKGIN